MIIKPNSYYLSELGIIYIEEKMRDHFYGKAITDDGITGYWDRHGEFNIPAPSRTLIKEITRDRDPEYFL